MKTPYVKPKLEKVTEICDLKDELRMKGGVSMSNRDGQFSHGAAFCEKFIMACIVFEKPKRRTLEEIMEEDGLMTVDQFIKSFEKRKQRHLTTHTHTNIMKGEKTNAT